MTQLNIRNLTVYYQKFCVLTDISFQVQKEEMIAVLGRNGCGKTTMLKAIAGSIPALGDIYVNGQNLHALSVKKRARLIAFLTQRFHVIDGISVKELIEFGTYSHDHLSKGKTSEQYITALTDHFQLTELLDKNYATLSEGQKQMIQLIKTLVQNTPVILLDEPDSALDFDNRHFLYRYIKQMVRQEKKSALIVLHDPVYALNYCDKIILIDQGKLVETIYKEDSLSIINQKIKKIYPYLTVEKDMRSNQYYTLFKEKIKSGK